MPKLPVVEPVPTAQACCSPLAAALLSTKDAAQLSMRLKALADPTRLRLVSLLLVSEAGRAVHVRCNGAARSVAADHQPPLQEADRSRSGHG